EKAARAQATDRLAESGGILVFVDIDEYQVKLAGYLVQQPERITHQHVDALGHARAPEVGLRAASVFRIAIRVIGPRATAGGPCQPTLRLPHGGAHLKDAFRAGDLDQQCEYAANRRADDGNVMAPSEPFHLPEYGVARWQQAIEIAIETFFQDFIHAAPQKRK